MRWDPTDELFRGDDYWRPRLWTSKLINGAQSDRQLWDDAMSEIAGFDVTAVLNAKAWAYSMRMALQEQATGSLGIPADLASSFAGAFGALVLSKPRDLEELGIALGKTVIGVVTQALSSIPVIGTIAAAVGALAQVLIDLKTKPHPEVQRFFPPPSIYRPENEEVMMNAGVLTTLSGPDWTSLVLPGMGQNFQISQRQHEIGAWVLDTKDAGPGIGFVPGTAGLTGPIQVTLDKASTRGGDQATGQDVGDFYPSVAQCLTGVLGRVQSPAAPLYSIRTAKVKRAWKIYLEALWDYLSDLWEGTGISGTGLETLTEEQRHIVVGALGAPLCVTRLNGKAMRGTLVTWSPSYTGETVYDAFVLPWCAAVEDRQNFYMDTITCAVVSPDAPLGAGMRRKMRRNRELLLRSPARWQVDLDDVIDDDYRSRLFQATVGGTLVAKTSTAPGSPDLGVDGEPAGTPPATDQTKGGVPFQTLGSGDGSGIGAALVAAAVIGVPASILLRRR